MKIVKKTVPHAQKVNLTSYGYESAKKAALFHCSFPAYQKTPLWSLDALARRTGVGKIYVKDESKRFDLNAFKVLGGSYAIGRCMAERLGANPDEMTYEFLTCEETRKRLGKLTFITATDGNHGRGVAWTARQMQQNCVVYLPKGSSIERLEHIQKLGADAMITDLNYDDTVRLARKKAKEHGWILVQDTSWDGYETIPSWIMQGYTTMGAEIIEQLGMEKPTHIFLQAGVGAMAGAMTAFFADYYKEEKPVIVIVEPDKADCIFQTAKADDGAIHTVAGDLDTIMAGLACGEPCTIAWEILNQYVDYYLSVSDEVAENGMRMLAFPYGDDEKIISGESGAAAFGAAMEALKKQELNLSKESRILCISTEGDTDKESYRRIVENRDS